MGDVRNLFEKKEEVAEEDAPLKPEQPTYDFAADMERNKRLKERKDKERLAANKGVLRSYRIKN